MSKTFIPPDLEQCQAERPSTWPKMPSFMALGPIEYTRCSNRPTWIASQQGGGSMTLCDECKEVMEPLFDDVECVRLDHGETEGGEG